MSHNAITSAKDLSALTTLRLPAFASRFAQADSREQLLELLHSTSADQPLLLLGGGSNLILSKDFDGLCVRICSRGIECQSLTGDSVLVRAQAGENWHDFVEFCIDNGWYGLENLALIPGTVGAAPIQNIGAYGVEVKDCIRSVEVWDRQQRTLCELDVAACGFGYRDSLFKSVEPDRYVILSVSFELQTRFQPQLGYAGLSERLGKNPEARDVFDAVVALRRQKLPDPEALANAGSFFKNPVISLAELARLKQRYPAVVSFPDLHGAKLAAAWLIDQAGWKGCRRAHVGVHSQQALVLVHFGGGGAAELLQLADDIRQDVSERYGVALEIEPRII
ncbi:UDP-N-acetylmuramate dehydrogenase [Motiliproteus coralliicola]|uniref:UDP-N-acetylmuramate dehydrogenase n=1 Tax=Motiliproteus coralliicola TaxID=2283196 RepID=UPI001FB3B033|nr:UDP-N-acetylmuramate dehydrogenase [Motiliproteus coralliicola]